MSTPRISFLALGLALAVGAWGCGHARSREEAPSPMEQAPEEPGGDSDHGNPFGLKSPHFDYRSSAIGAEAEQTLKADASILKEKPTLRIQIEGHCDSRGDDTRNFQLGEQRADAVRAFLVREGVPAGRLSTISYGKERPLETGSDEASMRANRRANLLVVAR